MFRAQVKDSYQTTRAVAIAQFKLKHEGSILGIFWYLLEPLLVFGVLMVVKSALDIEMEYYPAYLFLGLILFNFFSNTTNQASQSLLTNGGIIQWINVRLYIFPLAQVTQHVLSHSIELIILTIIFIVLDIPLLGLLWYPLVFLPIFFFTAGISLLLSITTIYIQDLSNVWRVLVGRLLWLGTPIFYTITAGTLLFTLNQWNPLFHFIELARSALLYQQLPSTLTLTVCIILPIVTFTFGVMVFKKLQHKAPEKV